MTQEYVLKCSTCNWYQFTTAHPDEIKDLHEVTSCASCGGRKFKCPGCGRIIKMVKIRS